MELWLLLLVLQLEGREGCRGSVVGLSEGWGCCSWNGLIFSLLVVQGVPLQCEHFLLLKKHNFIVVIHTIFTWYKWNFQPGNDNFRSTFNIYQIISILCNVYIFLWVNIFKKHLFLHQFTHNTATDCSLNYEYSTRRIQVQNKLCTKIVLNVKTKTKFLYTPCYELVHIFLVLNL